MAMSTEFHQLLDAAPDAMVMVDRCGRLTALNPEAERVFGWPLKELVGQPMNLIIPSRFQLLLEPLSGLGGTDRHSLGNDTFSCFAQRRDGTAFPVELSRRRLGSGRSAQSLLTVRDRSEWSRSATSRSRNNEDARAIVESIGDAVVTTGVDRMITYLNPVAERLTGWTIAEARGKPLDEVVAMISEVDRCFVANTAARCIEEGRPVELEDGVLLVRRDGTEVPIGDSAAPIRDRDGAMVGVVLVIQDESEKRRVGRQLSFEATHDGLTGLVNQRGFERRLEGLLTSHVDPSAEHFVVCLDLDRFKAVNDTAGHQAGDALLKNLGTLFGSSLRRGDTLARIGGDEFGIILENCPLEEAERIAENLRVAVEQYRFQHLEMTFPVSVSIGIVATRRQGDSVADILRTADAACYVAKDAGGNRVHVASYGPVSADFPVERLHRRTRIARAADEGTFRLYAQPMVRLQQESGAPARLEILLRLPDAEGRMEPAARFLPVAERCNLMPAIDRWVIRETIARLGEWRRKAHGKEVPICSVNLAASALADEGLVPMIERQLALHDVPPGALCFEITESAALADLRQASRLLAALRTIGCGMALDDFGGGVAAFTYLRALAVDYVKIGGHFMQRLVEDPIRVGIVGAIEQIGRSIGIFTVAKHVGSDAALEMLRNLGIPYAQGHALAAPAPLTDREGRLMVGDLLTMA